MSETSREITYVQAINEALRIALRKDDRVILLGEDIWWEGGTFGAMKGIPEEFGPTRVRETPIAESGFIGLAIGAAITGLRPIVELMFIDFAGLAMDAICNQAAKFRFMSGGKVKVPIVVRTSYGTCEGLGQASQHSQSLYSMFVHIPGLLCAVPSTPYDAKGLLLESARQEDPVIFCEHKCLYYTKGLVPDGDYAIPFGKASVPVQGQDVTVVAIGRMVSVVLNASRTLKGKGISVEVIDPRTLQPFDEQTVLNSVKKTGRLVVVDEDYPRCSVATDIAALVTRYAFDHLDAPIKLITPPHTSIPFSPSLEKFYIPNEETVVRTVTSLF